MVLEASVHGLLALLFGTRTRGGRSYLSHGIQETKRKMMEFCLLSLFLGKRGPAVSGMQLKSQGTHYRVCETFLVRC